MDSLHTIANIQNGFAEKFGIPRQSGLVDELRAQVVFTPEYRSAEAVRGLDEFSHIWLIWGFSKVPQGAWSPTVRPPRLGGNKRMGVFATRSPNRPNPLGLSCVGLESVEMHPLLGPVLHVRGADLLNGTPIYDIKPYLPYADSWPAAQAGFAQDPPAATLRVMMLPPVQRQIPEELQPVVRQVLAQDPRPAYQQEEGRVYGMRFEGLEIKFMVQGGELWITEVLPAQ